jgi:PX domain-containing protein kinase-like protein
MKSTAKVTLSALPPKSVFNKGKEFINKRRDGLQAYLQVLCAHPVLQHSLVLKKFVDPERYATNPWTEYFTGVGLFIRNSSTWELDERLGRFGWRYNKATAVVKGAGGADAGTPHLLTWTPLGYEVEYMSRELLGRTLHYMAELVHPNVMGAKHGEFCDTEGGATVVIRELCPAGSLKDRICNSSSKKQAAPPHKVNYCPKYGAGSDVGLPIADIQRFGAEILEGLKFLQDKLIPYGQLHTGNVLIKPDGSCALTDLETGLIPGVASIYAPFISELAHVESLQQQDVYAFGHVLYEMSVGHSLVCVCVCDRGGWGGSTALHFSLLKAGIGSYGKVVVAHMSNIRFVPECMR